MIKETRGYLRPKFHRYSLSEWHQPNRALIYDTMAPEEMGWCYWDCSVLELAKYVDTVTSFLDKIKEDGTFDFPSTLVSFSYHQRYQRLTFYFLHDDSKIILYKVWLEPQGFSIFEPRYSLEAATRLGWSCLLKSKSEKEVLRFLNDPVLKDASFYEPTLADKDALDLLEKEIVSPFLCLFKERPLVVNTTSLLALNKATRNFSFPNSLLDATATLEKAMKRIFSSPRITPIRAKLVGLSMDLLTCSPFELYSLLSYCLSEKDAGLSFAQSGVIGNVLNQIDELSKGQQPK